jgi:hypothetical protein
VLRVHGVRPALSVLREIRAFLESNPSEAVTVFLEDYTAPGSMARVLGAAGLTRYMLPVEKMPPRNGGGDWPVLADMIAWNQRLVVFTSKQGKEGSDGMAWQWNYVVETQYGSDGLAQVGQCRNRGESRPMDSKAQSLVLMNFFTSNPSQSWACVNNSSPLISKLEACYRASAQRWPNFIAVDFYMRSSGGGAPLATDVANGRLQCGADTLAYCNKPNNASSPSTSSPAPAPETLPPALPPTIGITPGPGPAMAEYSSRRRQVSEEEAATATMTTAAGVPDKAPTSTSTSTSTSGAAAATFIVNRRQPPWSFFLGPLLLLITLHTP